MTGGLRAAALRWRATARAAVVVEVAGTRGSVPRDSGTRMLVAADAVRGSIGGGHLELRAIADARALLRGADSVPTRQRIALGPTLGQCCGGVLELLFTPLAQTDPAAWPQAEPRFVLHLHGAGHVGRAIVRALHHIDCRVRWIDARDVEFPAEPSPSHIERICTESAATDLAAEVAAAPPGAFYLVLTHSHDLDLALSLAILQRADFGFFGLIGSQTKRARFEHRLQQRGIAPALLARMACPIGLPGITGKEPDVVAASAVAQLLLQSSAQAPIP